MAQGNSRGCSGGFTQQTSWKGWWLSGVWKETVPCQQREQYNQHCTGLREGGTGREQGDRPDRRARWGPRRPELVSEDLWSKSRSFDFLLGTAEGQKVQMWVDMLRPASVPGSGHGGGVKGSEPMGGSSGLEL